MADEEEEEEEGTRTLEEVLWPRAKFGSCIQEKKRGKEEIEER